MGERDSFHCQLTLAVTMSIDSAALNETVMHHAQAEEEKSNHQPSHKQNRHSLEPKRFLPFRCR
jgi:hypothetical protein